MVEEGRTGGVGPVVYNVGRIMDAHTHPTGQESAGQILVCLEVCGIEKVSLFALRTIVGEEVIHRTGFDYYE